MILVNEHGSRVCLECDEEFRDDDEVAWMRRHAACQASPEPHPT